MRVVVVLDGRKRVGALIVKPDMMLPEVRRLISQCFAGSVEAYSFLKDELVVGVRFVFCVPCDKRRVRCVRCVDGLMWPFVLRRPNLRRI